MKTLMIYRETESPLKFALLDGDFTHFNGVEVNLNTNPELEEEFVKFLFHSETGEYLIDLSEDISLLQNKEWDKVIICTFHS